MACRGVSRSLEQARAEARKCVLLRGNSRAEVAAGIAPVAWRDEAEYNGVGAPAYSPG